MIEQFLNKCIYSVLYFMFPEQEKWAVAEAYKEVVQDEMSRM